MTRRRAWLALAAIWLVPSAVLVGLTYAVYARYRIEVPAPLAPEVRAQVMAVVRAGVLAARPASNALGATDADSRQLPGVPAELARYPLAHRGPLVVTVWYVGRSWARAVAYGDTLAAATAEAARLLATDAALGRLHPNTRAAARIKVDVVVGRAPMAELHPLAQALGINPGLEGLGVTVAGRGEQLLMPDELIQHRLHATGRPLAFVPDFTIGFDMARAQALLAKAAAEELGPPSQDAGPAERRYWRLRTDSFIERPLASRDSGPPLALTRGLPPPPQPTPERLRAAALAGGRYLTAQLAPSGRYVYQRDLITGRGTDPSRPGPYSIPRHAGTTYFLAELYRITGEPWLREPVERATTHLEELTRRGGCRGTLPGGAAFACVVDRGATRAELGSTALTVVTLVEYRRATGDGRYDALARELTEWILYMQRPDGSFAHVYDVPTNARDERTQLMYYAGEAALALARMHAVTGEERYRAAAERALDEQVAWYEFFIGGFFHGEDHWTCIAAEAAWPAIQKDSYRRFCTSYGAFLRTHQIAEHDASDQEDWAGSYGFTPFIVPQNTPAGSRTEAMISAYLLSRYHQQPDEAIRAQILDAMRYALGQQIHADNEFFVTAMTRGAGSVPGSPVDRTVRIDYVQHVCSAMIRALELMESKRRR